KQGRAQEAIDAYKKALDLKPAQPKLNELYVKLAKAYLSVERSGNEEAYRSAVEQGIRWLQKVQEHKTAPASPDAAPRGSALPSRLTISLTKKAIDDLAKGNSSLEELRRAATI